MEILKGKYKGLQVIASKGICNTASVNIYDINDEEVVAGINNLQARKYKLYYNLKGDVYFNFGKRREYISDFLRI
jgi:hypothetical protein